MDTLTDQERALAWRAMWNPSFSGIAIVGPDYTFRAVNEQFCEIMGTTPAELVGNKFTDITPVSIRQLDIKNAELVKSGAITSYLLPKTFKFCGGREVRVLLLVKGVYSEDSNEFLFFVSRIVEDKRVILSDAPLPMRTKLLDWIDKKKVGMGVLTIPAAIGYGIAKYFFGDK